MKKELMKKTNITLCNAIIFSTILFTGGCDKMGMSCFDRKCTKVEKKFRKDLKNNDRIYFALNKSDLDDISRAVVAKQAEWLSMNPELGVMIYGHCDVRGSEKYNHNLGLMRALATKKELVKQGVDESRIKIGSKGKISPLLSGDGEEVWAQNRAAVTTVYMTDNAEPVA